MNTYLKTFISKNFKEPGRALDLGAGSFSDIAALEKMGWKCEGVDFKIGTDLEQPYQTKNQSFDLVYSNYVIQQIKNKKVFIETIYNNLKNEGWFFIHTFDKTNINSSLNLSSRSLKKC